MNLDGQNKYVQAQPHYAKALELRASAHDDHPRMAAQLQRGRGGALRGRVSAGRRPGTSISIPRGSMPRLSHFTRSRCEIRRRRLPTTTPHRP